MASKSAKSMGNATTRIPYRRRPINCIPSSQVTIEKIQGGIDLRFFKMKIRLILSKEDSFRSLPSNDYLEGYNEDGSSKLAFLGKASIDFAEFLTEGDPLIVSLPLKFSNSGAVLNVTIEKIQGGNDLRFFKMKIRSILSKEDSFRSLPSNDYLEGYNEDEVQLIPLVNHVDGWFGRECTLASSGINNALLFIQSWVPKGVGTDSNEGFDLSRLKRPMLRLHNPHLKNKIRGDIGENWFIYCTWVEEHDDYEFVTESHYQMLSTSWMLLAWLLRFWGKAYEVPSSANSRLESNADTNPGAVSTSAD
ncbi:hypothetical protein F2Q68_00010376 [Brassica cretica]|uniref:C2 NT-type domain-containing protein n=1 Tax=Brassica cretica TaxID=69181 RepID=A0A8S9KWC7_BRACR|nr:hypothetical protein F2Q68_00010376 [Brassica cretica]